MKYLSPQDILVIHAKIIDETGGLHGVRDVNLLASISHKPRTTAFGKEVYVNVFEKAAVYLEALVNYHVFNDGNKRTAIAVAAYFLSLNKIELNCSNKEMVVFVLKVVAEKLDSKTIAGWINNHTRELKIKK